LDFCKIQHNGRLPLDAGDVNEGADIVMLKENSRSKIFRHE
jgi:hypothetical protein